MCTPILEALSFSWHLSPWRWFQGLTHGWGCHDRRARSRGVDVEVGCRSPLLPCWQVAWWISFYGPAPSLSSRTTRAHPEVRPLAQVPRSWSEHRRPTPLHYRRLEGRLLLVSPLSVTSWGRPVAGELLLGSCGIVTPHWLHLLISSP